MHAQDFSNERERDFTRNAIINAIITYERGCCPLNDSFHLINDLKRATTRPHRGQN